MVLCPVKRECEDSKLVISLVGSMNQAVQYYVEYLSQPTLYQGLSLHGLGNSLEEIKAYYLPADSISSET